MTRDGTRHPGGARLSQRAAEVVALTLDGLTPTEIAQALSRHRSTVYRALDSVPVVQALAAARAAQFAAIADGAAARARSALAVVGEIITDTGADPSLRLRAAEVALARLGPTVELVDVTGRLAEVERRLAERQAPAPRRPLGIPVASGNGNGGAQHG
ncbi:MAG: helix-turn-helix domain-containing protein [Planctomycetales bacterium]|nr:helix-turn-helix domain-containing protein [Planctomycetales bacterium]